MRREIRSMVFEALSTAHYEQEKNGYRLKDLYRSGQMSKEVYIDILGKLEYLEGIEFPRADIALKVFSSPISYTTDEPKNKSYSGNDFWIVLDNNKILSLMNRPLRKRPMNADYYLTFEYIRKMDKKELTLHDLNPANKEKKVGARLLRQLEKLPKLNIGSRDWFIDSEKEVAYPQKDIGNRISFDSLLNLATSNSDFAKLEPLMQERNERRKKKLNGDFKI
jgi:hypothetical protein|tara:strand:- start:21552 stop:22217 length:666 start_codon:yes stop_codon:yes gene_type:complete